MTKTMCCLLASLCAAIACRGTAYARVYAPRIVSPHNPDVYSLRTFAEFPRWRGLNGDARAWEIYRYLADTRTGLFHMNEVLEGSDDLSEYRTVRDPIKILAVYGYGYCAIFGPVMAGICEGAGLGQARTITLNDWRHVAAETYYDGAWHYLDIDVRAIFQRPDGTLASMQDARTNDSLWTGRGPLFFPNDPLAHARGIYRTTPVNYYHDFFTGGHTMDFVLRQGESLTRWWKPQGGRWHHSPEYNRVDWLRTLIEKEPRGPAPNHRHFTVHNYGNGKFVYAPDLTVRSSDFEDGVYDQANVRTGTDGLTLRSQGDGYAIFEVRSPYIIVPEVGDLDTTEDDHGAAILDVDGVGATLAISIDNGMTWSDLEFASSPAALDLTRYVSGRYGYLLRVTLTGAPEQAVLRSMGITTWVQVAPAALPSLRRGRNRLTFRTGDHRGRQTRVVEVSPPANRPEELLKYLVEAPADYDPARRTGRIRGPVLARVEAPPGTAIAWFSAGASFRTHQGEAARRTRNSIAYTVDRRDGDYTTIYQANVPTYCGHWHYNADREVVLERPARTLFVRYVGDPAVNNIRVYAHCIDTTPPRLSPVTVTHRWLENGTLKRRSVALAGPGSYELIAGDDPQDESIEISVSSAPVQLE